jgi:histidinol-phosphate aminotransferase
LRIGWMFAPANVIDAVNRVRGPFNVNAVAIAAGAAAIRDRAHVEKSVEHNNRWLPWVTGELEALGLKVTPSVANFVLIHFPDDTRHDAEAADRFLLSKGLVVRRVAAYGFPNALRMTIGGEEANRGVIAALKDFLGR